MIVASRNLTGAPGSEQINNEGEIVVYSVEDRGDVPPRLRIGAGFLKIPRGIGLDPSAQNVVVSDKIGNRIVTFHVPEIFAATATQ